MKFVLYDWVDVFFMISDAFHIIHTSDVFMSYCLHYYSAGLDVHLFKQAHFLMLAARDLQSDVGEWCSTLCCAMLCLNALLTDLLMSCTVWPLK